MHLLAGGLEATEAADVYLNRVLQLMSSLLDFLDVCYLHLRLPLLPHRRRFILLFPALLFRPCCDNREL